MKKSALLGCLVALATVSGGCSTRPRNFVAQINMPAGDTATLQSDYQTCSGLVAAGHRSNFRDNAVTGAATGAGALGTAAGMSVGGLGLLGSYAAAATAIPVVGALAGFGISRVIRGNRERRVRTAMTDCLGEFGYTVADWERIDRREDASELVTSRLVAADVAEQALPEASEAAAVTPAAETPAEGELLSENEVVVPSE